MNGAFVTIDTNVFLHLFAADINNDSHIEQLLVYLRKQEYRLCVDNHNKICSEYNERICPMIKTSSDTGVQIYLLRFWMGQDVREEVHIDLKGDLLAKVTRILPQQQCGKDRFFVAVAAKKGCVLVTNDKHHILANRQSLRRETKSWHRRAMDIVDSTAAMATLSGVEN